MNKEATKRFKRLEAAVAKFNQLRAGAIALTGSDDSIYYDNSSTIDMGPEYIGSMRLGQDDNAVYVEYETVSGLNPHERYINRENAPIDAEGYFYADDLRDTIRFMTNCVKRAIRWFKQYNPDMTDEQAEKILNGPEE